MAQLAGSYKRHADFEGYDALVIGSGIGGLSVAALLARYGGRRVLVLERHYVPGGFTHTFTREGYEWDVGVHYIGQVLSRRALLRRLFDVLTDGRVRWASLGEVYDRAIIGDFTFDFVAGRENLRAALYAAFPNEKAAIDGYFHAVKAVTAASRGYFMAKLLPMPLGKAAALTARKFYRYADRTVDEVLTGLGASPLLKAVLTAQYGDYGLPPGQASFAMHAMLAHHYMEGGAYPVGGAGVFARHIIPRIRAADGEVLVRAEVEQILVRDGRAVGVRMADGREIFAPRIISDAGFATTFGRLVPEDVAEAVGARRALARIGVSMTDLVLHVGLESAPSALDLPKHNFWIYPYEDHDASVARFLADPEAPFPMLFVSSSSARDPDYERRHPGRSVLEVITAANWEWFRRWEGTRWMQRGEDYQAFKARMTERMLTAVEAVLPQVRGRVKVAELATPLSVVTFTNHPQGSIYGLAHTPARFREPLLRPATPIRNLYLTGADVVTAGVGGAAMGGMLTAGVILKRNIIRDVVADA